MSLDEAIKHLEETIVTIECKECKEEHMQLHTWLCELRDIKIERDKEFRNYITKI